MATRSTKTAPPPIQTADHHDMDIGDPVYGVDKNCRNRDIPKVEPLTVIQLDLGVKREVRLRRKNGVEWTWNAHGDGCSAEKLLYKSYAKARSVAVEAAKKNREGYTARVENQKNQVEREKKDTRREEQKLEEAKQALKDFDRQVSELRNSTAPDK